MATTSHSTYQERKGHRGVVPMYVQRHHSTQTTDRVGGQQR